MQYQITDLTPAPPPLGGRDGWWKMKAVLSSFKAESLHEALERLAAACFLSETSDIEADLNVYGRGGYQLVATRYDGESRIALWEKE